MNRTITAFGKTAAMMSLAILFPVVARAAEPAAASKGDSMTYRQVKDFLSQHTKVVELTDGAAARVLVCPEYQGRVMTSTCSGEDGASLGWINRKFIEEGKPSAQFNNYGGEDRIWLGPEGGQFSLWFGPGVRQEFANWFTPPALNEGAFDAVPALHDNPGKGIDKTIIDMHRDMKFSNAAKTDFHLLVDRSVQLLGPEAFGQFFGADAQSLVADGKLNSVGFVSANKITNHGAPMKKAAGLVSIWILSMMNSSPETVIIAPYRAGSEAELGPVVKADYFGVVPPERLKITPAAILFRGDSHYRSKIGVSQRRVKPMAGSINYRDGILTLVTFDMPDKPADQMYLNNAWDLPQKEPFVGDVLNSYNDGPPASLGAFYEIESLSPAKELAPGQSLRHRHVTFHIQGDLQALARLAKVTLGVDLDTVHAEMLGK
jgi:uncharacterized protein DUF6786